MKSNNLVERLTLVRDDITHASMAKDVPSDIMETLRTMRLEVLLAIETIKAGGKTEAQRVMEAKSLDDLREPESPTGQAGPEAKRIIKEQQDNKVRGYDHPEDYGGVGFAVPPRGNRVAKMIQHDDGTADPKDL